MLRAPDPFKSRSSSAACPSSLARVPRTMPPSWRPRSYYGARFRNAGADQRADQRAGGAAGARACDRAGDGPATSRPTPGMEIVVAAAIERTERRADTDTDAAPDARALGRLRAFLELVLRL